VFHYPELDPVLFLEATLIINISLLGRLSDFCIAILSWFILTSSIYLTLSAKSTTSLMSMSAVVSALVLALLD
jgi:hypothetical protein